MIRRTKDCSRIGFLDDASPRFMLAGRATSLATLRPWCSYLPDATTARHGVPKQIGYIMLNAEAAHKGIQASFRGHAHPHVLGQAPPRIRGRRSARRRAATPDTRAPAREFDGFDAPPKAGPWSQYQHVGTTASWSRGLGPADRRHRREDSWPQ